MPNYIQNVLNVQAPSSKEMSDFLSEMRGSDLKWGNNIFDFNKIIPMPECLKDTESSSYANDCIDFFLMNTKRKDVIAKAQSQHLSQRQFDDLTDEQKEEMMRIGEAYYEKFVECGHYSWYTWRVDNWGTKWNAFNAYLHSDGDSAYIAFQTAWSGVPDLIDKLTTMYPTFSFDYMFADEDLTYNCGTGHTDEELGFVFSYAVDGSDDAFKIYTECWGEDPNDFIKTENGWTRKY